MFKFINYRSNSYLQSSQGQLLANLLDHSESFRVLKILELREIVVMVAMDIHKDNVKFKKVDQT